MRGASRAFAGMDTRRLVLCLQTRFRWEPNIVRDERDEFAALLLDLVVRVRALLHELIMGCFGFPVLQLGVAVVSRQRARRERRQGRAYLDRRLVCDEKTVYFLVGLQPCDVQRLHVCDPRTG